MSLAWPFREVKVKAEVDENSIENFTTTYSNIMKSISWLIYNVRTIEYYPTNVWYDWVDAFCCAIIAEKIIQNRQFISITIDEIKRK